jgi:hypothetical protein
MFSFFGLFADPVSGLPERISEAWPGLNVIRMEQPISAIGVRFGRDLFKELEDIPEPVIRAVENLSAESGRPVSVAPHRMRWGDDLRELGSSHAVWDDCLPRRGQRSAPELDQVLGDRSWAERDFRSAATRLSLGPANRPTTSVRQNESGGIHHAILP